MSEYTPLKVEYINPFLSAAVYVFRTMLKCEIKRGRPYLYGDADEHVSHEISGVIGLSGKAVGTVVLGVSREVAIRATGVMIADRPGDLNAEVVDAIGELTNMIAGNAKAQLPQLEMNLGLPNVIIGKGHRVAFPTEITPICIPFESPWGSLALQVGLCHQACEVAAI